MASHPISINDSNSLNTRFAMYDNMSQVNFRMNEDEKLVITALAKQKGISVAELARQALINEIMPMRVNLAFNLLKDGQIGRKRAWKLSGLSYHEFMVEWSKRGAVEQVPDAADRKGIETALNLDISKYMKQPPGSQ